jgi:mannosylglycerate hydrolase
MMSRKYAAIVAHTHWDREWYQTFQGFRKRLVYMIDHLIETMENDPSYKYFFFDGQTIVLEDYLEIRPENRDRLAALIKAGRIEIGPWYGMPDEFLLSGESIIRNLLRGSRIARSYGVEPCKCGYVCDIFGHNSQFPQILNGFGIDTAVLYRGIKDNSVPAEVYWESPDGSRVLGGKLDSERSYSDFYFAIRWPFEGREYDEDELIERMKQHLAHKSSIQSSNVFLMLEGVDHAEIDPKLPWIIETLNKAFPDVEFEHTTMAGYFEKLKAEDGGFPVIKGELLEPGYRGVNTQVLSNVWSSRVDIKKQNDFCQELLTKWAEPLNVFAAASGKAYPYGFLRKAWEYLMRNHPHDSICGCSIGQVHRDMKYRFDQCRLIAEEMIEESLRHFGEALDTSSCKGDHTVTIFNNSEISEDKVYIFELSFSSLAPNSYILLYDNDGSTIPYQILEINPYLRYEHDFGELIKFKSSTRVKAAARFAIPSMGYKTLSYEVVTNRPPGPGEYTFKDYKQPIRYLGTMVTGFNTFENEYLTVTVNGNGTIDVYDKETGNTYKNLLLLEDRGEVGDGWNYRKPAQDSIYTSHGMNADIAVIYDGINVVSIKISYTMRLPAGIEGYPQKRSSETGEMGVSHEIMLVRSSRLLNVKTTIDNRVKNHIVKVLFPTGLDTDKFYTDTPFDLIERSFIHPDRSDYTEIDTKVVPSQGYLKVEDLRGGLAIFTKGLYEYEAYEDNNRTLALTLMRCFSNEVGTLGGTDGQLLGENVFEYAIRFCRPDEEGLYKEYQQYKAGLKWTFGKRQTGSLPSVDSYVRLSNSDVIISCLKRAEDEEGAYIIRLFNLSDKPVEDSLVFKWPLASCYLVNLDEKPIRDHEYLDNEVPISLGGKKIVTLKISYKA